MGNFDDIIRQVLANYPTTTAQVPPDTMSDVGPVTMGHWVEPLHGQRAPVDVGDEVPTEVDPFRVPQNIVNRSIDRSGSEDGYLTYATAIANAIANRQKLGRREE